MKKFLHLSAFLLLLSCLAMNVAFSYEQKTIKEIVSINKDSLSSSSYLSDYYGDTVVVRGTAQVAVLLNATGGDRRPIMITGKSWLTYISAAGDAVGIAVFQRDTTMKTTQFDKIKAGDSIEFTAIVTTLPYEFDAFSQRRLALPALELIPTIPVKTLTRNIKLDIPNPVLVSDFYKGTRARNPQTSGVLFAGRKVQFDSLVVSAVSPQLTFADSKGNEIAISDQSGYYTTKNHYIEESMFSSYTVGQKIYKAQGFVTTIFIPGQGGGMGGGGGAQLYSFALAPALPGDIVTGPKPAVISLVAQRPSKLFPSSNDRVDIVYDVLSGSYQVPFDKIALNYSVNGGNTYTKLIAQEDVTGSWINSIPAQAGGTIVRYFLSAEDEQGNVFRHPVADEYYYKVVDSYPKISDIKTPDTISGIKNTQGTTVTVEGIVMCDSTDIYGDKFQNPARVTIQDGIGPYSGAAFLRMGNNSKAMQLKRGQKVRLLVKLQEWNGVVYFSSIDSLEVLGTENPYPAVALSTSVFTTNPGGTPNADQWRDMLVQFNTVSIASIEPSAPQLTGEFVIVDEALKADQKQGIRLETDESALVYSTRDSIIAITNRVKPTIGETIDFVRGIITADFRTGRYKLVPRFNRDFSKVTSVEDEVVLTSAQLYPNPAQSFVSIPLQLDVKNSVRIDIIQPSTGEIVHSMLDQNLNAGNYTVTIQTSMFVSGMYIANVTIGNQVKSMPFAIQQ